jgi:hypothetical protein
MKHTPRVVAMALLLGWFAVPLVAQEGTVTRDEFSWSDPVPAGAWLRIHNQNGPIEVRESAGRVAEVRAELRPSSGQLPEVSFRVVRDGENVTICAMPAGSTCTPEGLQTGRRSIGRGSVAFTVMLPAGVKVRASSGSGSVAVRHARDEVVATTGSGSVHVSASTGPVRARTGSGTVEVADVSGPVNATTGSGGIRVSTSGGPVNATTGSGNIDVRMLALRATGDMHFRTGSGAIRLHLPNDFAAEIDATTGSGRISTDFPLTVQGSMGRNRLRGTIGEGGRQVRLTTGSGGIELHRLE